MMIFTMIPLSFFAQKFINLKLIQFTIIVITLTMIYLIL